MCIYVEGVFKHFLRNVCTTVNLKGKQELNHHRMARLKNKYIIIIIIIIKNKDIPLTCILNGVSSQKYVLSRRIENRGPL